MDVKPTMIIIIIITVISLSYTNVVYSKALYTFSHTRHRRPYPASTQSSLLSRPIRSASQETSGELKVPGGDAADNTCAQQASSFMRGNLPKRKYNAAGGGGGGGVMSHARVKERGVLGGEGFCGAIGWGGRSGGGGGRGGGRE